MRVRVRVPELVEELEGDTPRDDAKRGRGFLPVFSFHVDRLTYFAKPTQAYTYGGQARPKGDGERQRQRQRQTYLHRGGPVPSVDWNRAARSHYPPKHGNGEQLLLKTPTGREDPAGDEKSKQGWV